MPPKSAAAEAASAEAHSTAKLDQLMAIQRTVQERWNKNGDHSLFNAEPKPGQPKYMITFPYPYMNGRLHLGHGFSFSKCEFAARFQRMKGKNVLWGFGLHVTGTPIAACAQKLRNEMAKYGNPPQFPPDILADMAEAKKAAAESAAIKAAETGKHQGKKAKQAPAKPQWMIMQDMGIPDSEIAAFASPMRWLEYFPELALEDTRAMGCHIDYRRSFITTDVNPYYDSFVRWQFEILQKKKLLGFGERYCIYTTVDKQPCADHDRASGEGVAPQEYVVVKLLAHEPEKQRAFQAHVDKIAGRRVVLPGATLRCETVVGQTNVWVSPTVTYQAYDVVPIMSPSALRKLGKDPESIVPIEGAKHDIFITTQRCANNLAYQNYLVSGVTRAQPKPLFEVPGEQLVGLPIAAPNCPYPVIYALPMSTISDSKGTAVVMSVPSDSPDDWINFMTLYNKPDFRAKLNIKDEWILPFKPMPIIDIPGELGDNCAEIACGKFKVNGPKDEKALADAKELCYNEGFYKGVMKVGPLMGTEVKDAKKKMADIMVADGTAILYQEPQKQVINRSGDECVVALCDQWFLSYSQEEWKKPVRDFIRGKLDTFAFPGIKSGLAEAADWLSEWPCSRNFGLGTTMPSTNPDEERIIIDSLSDSTIYMAYYTVAKYLHAKSDKAANMPVKDVLKGTIGEDNKYGIRPENMTSQTWDYIFLGKGSAEEVNKATGLAVELAEQMRSEFSYFYPCDLRTSGKDLIQNHLTMALFNHAAIWEGAPDKWIQSIYCNGHIQVDGEKMAKSLGNFILMRDALKEYSADGTRLALAEAGDSLNDANFVRSNATEHIMRLTALISAFKDRHEAIPKMRSGGAESRTLFDNMFDNTISDTVQKAEQYYEKMMFQKAMQTIFFEMPSEITQYELACGSVGPHAEVISRLHDVWPRLLAPIVPHTADYLWTDVMKKAGGSVHDAPWPTIPADKAVDATYAFANKLINDVMAEIRATATRLAKKKQVCTTAYVFTADKYLPWQVAGLAHMQGMRDKETGELPADTIKQITSATPPLPWLDKKLMQEIMGFLSFQKANAEKYGPKALDTTPPVNDADVLNRGMEYVTRQSGMQKVVVLTAGMPSPNPEAHDKMRDKARPGMPYVCLE